VLSLVVGVTCGFVLLALLALGLLSDPPDHALIDARWELVQAAACWPEPPTPAMRDLSDLEAAFEVLAATEGTEPRRNRDAPAPSVPRVQALTQIAQWLARDEPIHLGVAAIERQRNGEVGTWTIARMLDLVEVLRFAPHDDPAAVAGALDVFLALREQGNASQATFAWFATSRVFEQIIAGCCPHPGPLDRWLVSAGEALPSLARSAVALHAQRRRTLDEFGPRGFLNLPSGRMPSSPAQREFTLGSIRQGFTRAVFQYPTVLDQDLLASPWEKELAFDLLRPGPLVDLFTWELGLDLKGLVGFSRDARLVASAVPPPPRTALSRR